MPVKLGVAPIAWSNDDLPELGGDTPLETCLAEAKKAGFAGVEKGGKFPLAPAELGPLLEAHGLRLVSGWFSGRMLDGDLETEKKRIADQLHLYRALGCPVMVYAETIGTVQGAMDTPVSRRPRLGEDAIKRYAERLTPFAEWLRAEGCPLSFHHHMGTVIESEQDLDLLMRHSGDAVGLLLDTGHLAFAGGNVEATTRRWAARINHVHVKDIRAEVLARLKAEDWSFLKGVLEGVFTVPGDGSLDYKAFCGVLAEIGYRGWIVVEAEQDPAKAEPYRYSKMGRDHLVACLGAAGIAIAD